MDLLDRDIIRFYLKVHKYKDKLRTHDFLKYPQSLSAIAKKHEVTRMCVHKRVVKLERLARVERVNLRKLVNKPYYGENTVK